MASTLKGYENGIKHEERQEVRKELLRALDNRVRSPQIDDFVRELVDEVIPEEE